MEKEQAVRVIVEVLESIQDISGRYAGAIGTGTCPIGDLVGFDSLCGVEATVELSEKLGIELRGSSVFVDEKGTKARTVGEIADAVCRAVTEASQ